MCWLVSRHDDARAVLRSGGVVAWDLATAIDALCRRGGCAAPHVVGAIGANLLFLSGERHRRLRGQASERLRKAADRTSAPCIGTLVAGLCDGLPAAGEVDIVASLSRPLTYAVTADLLGLPPEAVATAVPSAVALLEALVARPSLRDYRRLEAELAVAHARLLDAPRPHIAPSTADDDLQPFSELFLISAATYPTGSAIATTVEILAHLPDLQAELRLRPDKIGGFVEEALRLAPSATRLSPQETACPIEIGDWSFEPGQRVIVDVRRANRDPSTFPDPLRIDLDRKGAPHLAFSAGAHACLGARLSRLLMAAVTDALLSRYRLSPGAPAPEIDDSGQFRTVRTLPIRLAPLE